MGGPRRHKRSRRATPGDAGSRTPCNVQPRKLRRHAAGGASGVDLTEGSGLERYEAAMKAAAHAAADDGPAPTLELRMRDGRCVRVAVDLKSGVSG